MRGKGRRADSLKGKMYCRGDDVSEVGGAETRKRATCDKKTKGGGI